MPYQNLEIGTQTGQPNTVLYYKNYPQRSGNRGLENYRGNFRSRNNNYNNNGTQYNNGQGQYRGNYRGRGNSSRGHNNNNQGNVRVTNNTSGNSQIDFIKKYNCQ